MRPQRVPRLGSDFNTALDEFRLVRVEQSGDGEKCLRGRFSALSSIAEIDSRSWAR
jgi:hypothetical protein